MATQFEAPMRAPRVRVSGFGVLVKQTLLFLFTLALGITLVVLIGMTRRDLFLYEGTDRPPGLVTDRYPNRVRDYLSGLLRGQLSGASATPIVDKRLMLQVTLAVRQSLQLLGVTLLFALPIGLIWGALMAWQHETRLGALLAGANILVLAIPSFVVLLVMIITIANITLRTGVRLAFTQGYGMDRHLIVPVTVLALRGTAYFAQVVAVAQREVAGHEWVRYARAKGLDGFRLWRNHVLPLLTLPLLGGLLGLIRVLVGAQLLVEFLYNWGGMGKLLIPVSADSSITLRSEPVEIAALVLLVIFFVVTDSFGRLALWGIGRQRHERGSTV